jgi:leucyl aminopeptidase
LDKIRSVKRPEIMSPGPSQQENPIMNLPFVFKPFALPEEGDLVVLINNEGVLGEVTAAILGSDVQKLIKEAASAESFKGKVKTALVIPAPANLKASRLVIVGTGSAKDHESFNAAQLGGTIMGKVVAKTATIFLDIPSLALTADQAAHIALGAQMRSYRFDRYKTKKKDEDKIEPSALTFCVPDALIPLINVTTIEGLSEGINLARDLVNEPPNVLGPEEFAAKAQDLSKLGVEVEILDEADLKRIGMGALLGVAQGSPRPPRVALMHWKGGKEDEAPLAIIGKGVVFDSGGISIKPAASMEDMKGDMAGAACVVGLMHVLARRKAKANVVGVIGLVENMPDGAAQRPGDIVTTLSGQSVEIINTDAEGRLVLADLLWYVRDRYKPSAMINLATLTGAILVALGQDHAGLFSNNDDLSARITSAGLTTGERVWRMPLATEYDKMIDSKFADMKNTGGRFAGSITAAQFLKRFVEETPWAHLDIAGTAMSAPQTETNKSWGSGWGVRLLNEMIG